MYNLIGRMVVCHLVEPSDKLIALDWESVINSIEMIMRMDICASCVQRFLLY